LTAFAGNLTHFQATYRMAVRGKSTQCSDTNSSHSSAAFPSTVSLPLTITRPCAFIPSPLLLLPAPPPTPPSSHIYSTRTNLSSSSLHRPSSPSSSPSATAASTTIPALTSNPHTEAAA
ncbi:unnamed protein product, partial [Closterium sp. NIES-53]